MIGWSEDLVWLAGLFEGEGCISLQRRHVTLGVAMLDRDVIERVAALWGVPVSQQRKSACRALWRARIGGRRALPWIEALFPRLGERRQERILDIAYRMAA